MIVMLNFKTANLINIHKNTGHQNQFIKPCNLAGIQTNETINKFIKTPEKQNTFEIPHRSVFNKKSDRIYVQGLINCNYIFSNPGVQKPFKTMPTLANKFYRKLYIYFKKHVKRMDIVWLPLEDAGNNSLRLIFDSLHVIFRFHALKSVDLYFG